jgi:hypothetical protein
MLPWVILSGLGLYSVVLLIYSRVEGKSKRLMVLGAFFAFVFLVLLNESMRYISNINIW